MQFRNEQRKNFLEETKEKNTAESNNTGILQRKRKYFKGQPEKYDHTEHWLQFSQVRKLT